MAPGARAGRPDIDLVLNTAGRRFVVEVRNRDDLSSLERASATLHHLQLRAADIRLIVVPFMGPATRVWAGERDISRADLSGTAENWLCA